MAAGERAQRSTAVRAAALADHLSRQLLLLGGSKQSGNSGGGGGGGGGTQPTLAQRLRLVAGPPRRLTAADWERVHLQSLLRQDCKADCAICLQPFRAEATVLLSCSHVFHRQCLSSFEQYSQAAVRSCPLCRCAAYQKCRVADGERHWRHACAARIQAAWRGYRARVRFAALAPPQHPALKRRWCAQRLHRGAAEAARAVEQGSSEIDALFAELEGSLAQSRAAGAALAQRGIQTRPSASINSSSGGIGEGGGRAGRPGGGVPAAAVAWGQRQQCALEESAALEKSVDWEAVVARCLRRSDDPDCAVCLAPLARRPEAPPSSSPACTACAAGTAPGRGPSSSPAGTAGAAPGGGPSSSPACTAGAAPGGGPSSGAIAVLSCSHAFHSDCLNALLAWALASDLKPSCPCCRAAPFSRIEL